MLLDPGDDARKLLGLGHRAQIGSQRPVRGVSTPTSQRRAHPLDVMTPVLFLVVGELCFHYGGEPVGLRVSTNAIATLQAEHLEIVLQDESMSELQSLFCLVDIEPTQGCITLDDFAVIQKSVVLHLRIQTLLLTQKSAFLSSRKRLRYANSEHGEVVNEETKRFFSF